MNYFKTFLLISYLFAFSDGNLEFVNKISDFVKNDAETRLLETYDFVIVGAGSAGSVIASRLSENKNWSILVLEAGKEENYFTDIPLLSAFQSVTSYNWNFVSEKSNTSCLSLKNNRCSIHRGKAVGGSSVINFLIYSRGNRLDFDEWNTYGNVGWSYKDLLPYFIKSENCSFGVEADDIFHGREGPVNIQYPPFHTSIRDRFLEAGVLNGYRNTDPNGRFHIGFSKVQATMINGKRCSAAKAYLLPIKKRSNLHIVTEARATRVAVDPKFKKTEGVEFIKNGIKRLIKIRKEVVLSAGSINSPQLLMLSGIGPREDLERLNIPVIKNLRVGYNLQDHSAFVQSFLINESVTISDLKVQHPSNLLNYILNNDGPFTIPGGAEALAFINTTTSSSDYPDIELVFGAGGFNNDFYGSLRKAYGLSDKLFYKIYGSVLFTPAFSITVVLLRPRSRGRIVLKDSNPLHAPAIHLNYFENESDLDVIVDGIEMAKKIGESKTFQKYSAKFYNFTIPGCKDLPLNSKVHRACLVRHLATSLGHQVGTCKMGPVHDTDAVVDPELRVYGVKNLRVIDGSILPNIVAGHTNSVIMMIGEKGSDLIKNTWRKSC